MEKFWSGFEKKAYSWKAQAIGAATAPVAGAAIGAVKADSTPYRGAIMGGMAGGGAALGSSAGKLMGDLMIDVASGNPEKLKKLHSLGKFLPLILGIGGASMGSYKAMKWLAGIREGSPQEEAQEQPSPAGNTGR